MANTYLTSNARFKPFSYQEMLAPVLAYKEAYETQEAALGELDILAKDIAGKIEAGNANADLRNAYNEYTKLLQKASQDFYNNGYNAQTRKELLGLKATFMEKLNPINDAYKNYTEDQKYLSRLQREHPEMIVEGIGNSISDYMYGKMPSGITANKEDIYTKSMNAAKGTSSRFSFINNPASVLGGQYWSYKSGKGISQSAVEELNSFMTNKDAISSEEGMALYNIVAEQRKTHNYDSFTKEGKDQIDAAILSGIFAGVSKDEDIKYMADQSYMNDLEKLKYKMALQESGDPEIDQDYRGTLGIYQGENSDISDILAKMFDYEINGKATPVKTKDGTTLYNAIDTYNYIHEGDDRIAAINKILNDVIGTTKKDRKTTMGTVYNPNMSAGVWNSPNGNIQLSYEEVGKLFAERDTLEQRYKDRYNQYKDVSLSDKEVARLRAYNLKDDDSSYSGLLTQEELVALDSKASSDITTMKKAKDDATIIASKEYGRLKDIVSTMQSNIDSLTSFVAYDEKGKPYKQKGQIPEFTEDNVSKIELDYKSFTKPIPSVRVVSGGKSYYIPIYYFGSGVSNRYFSEDDNNVKELINNVVSGTGSNTEKMNTIQTVLRGLASGIQTDFSTQIEQWLSTTNKDRAKAQYLIP